MNIPRVNGVYSRWQLAGSVLAFAFPVLALVVDKSASVIFTVFFLAGAWLLVRGPRERPDASMRFLLFAFAAYFAVGVLCFFLGEQTRLGEKILGRDIRFLAAVPVFFVLMQLPARAWLIRNATWIGGALAAAVAIVQIQVTDRAGGETISIVFGHLCAALFAVNLVCMLYLQRRQRIAAVLGTLGALVAVLLSGTRGALMSVAVVIAIVSIAWAGRSVRRWISVLACALAGTVAMFASGVHESVTSRIEQGVAELAQFQEGSKLDVPMEAASCPASETFLHALVDNGRVHGDALGIRIERVQDAESLRSLACDGEYVLVLHNAGKKAAWLMLPTRNVPADRRDATLLVRGTAMFLVNGAARDAWLQTRTTAWQRIRLDGSTTKDSRVRVILEPGDEIRLLPVASTAGEYAFPSANTSVGARFYMWQAASDAFLDAPVLGHGTGAYPAVTTAHAAAGEGPWSITEYDHAHNEMFTVAAERGLLGLLALFAVYVAPFLVFRRRGDVFGMAGMAFVVSVAVSGLTETIFNHSLGITYYCMLVLLLATALHAQPATNELFLRDE